MGSGIRQRWILVLVALAVAVALAIAYLGTMSTTDTATQSVEKLRLALPTLPSPALVHLALAKGYFAEEGLELEITPVTHGRAALDLVLAGKADLATAAEAPLVISAMKGAKIAIVATIMSSTTQNRVIARRDRGISAPADLAQKRIGVTFGTGGDYFFWAYLVRHKLAPESVTYVDVPPMQIPQALAAGTVDAAATWNPISATALAALGGNGVSFGASNVYAETHIVVGQREFLSAHPGAMKRLVRALLKAERFVLSEPEQARTLLVQRLEIDADVLRTTWGEFDFTVNLLQSQLITLEDEARWAMARGYAEKRPLHNFLLNLYLDALLSVQPDRVTVLR